MPRTSLSGAKLSANISYSTYTVASDHLMTFSLEPRSACTRINEKPIVQYTTCRIIHDFLLVTCKTLLSWSYFDLYSVSVSSQQSLCERIAICYTRLKNI